LLFNGIGVAPMVQQTVELDSAPGGRCRLVISWQGQLTVGDQKSPSLSGKIRKNMFLFLSMHFATMLLYTPLDPRNANTYVQKYFVIKKLYKTNYFIKNILKIKNIFYFKYFPIFTEVKK
jgi:hypothetical protein